MSFLHWGLASSSSSSVAGCWRAGARGSASSICWSSKLWASEGSGGPPYAELGASAVVHCIADTDTVIVVVVEGGWGWGAGEGRGGGEGWG